MVLASKLQSSLKVNSELVKLKPGIKGPANRLVLSLFPVLIRSGHIRHCGHFWTQIRGSKYKEDREKKNITHRLSFVNALFLLKGTLRACGKPLFCPGHTSMYARVLSAPCYTLPAHRQAALEGFRYQDIPGELNRGQGEGGRNSRLPCPNSPSYRYMTLN